MAKKAAKAAKVKAPAAPTKEIIVIKPPNFKTAIIKIKGNAPYVQHAFSAKARAIMRGTQESGTQSRSRKVRAPKNFQTLYEDAKHISTDRWCGIPAPAFRDAAISACRLVGFKMTHAKLSLFIIPDGFDKDGTPLIRIIGTPHQHEAAVRLANGSVDIRVRPMWREWKAEVKVRWDADQFSATDIMNLFARVGMQVGVGEGRADSPNSNGQGWGSFDIAA